MKRYHNGGAMFEAKVMLAAETGKPDQVNNSSSANTTGEHTVAMHSFKYVFA